MWRILIPKKTNTESQITVQRFHLWGLRERYVIGECVLRQSVEICLSYTGIPALHFLPRPYKNRGLCVPEPQTCNLRTKHDGDRNLSHSFLYRNPLFKICERKKTFYFIPAGSDNLRAPKCDLEIIEQRVFMWQLN